MSACLSACSVIWCHWTFQLLFFSPFCNSPWLCRIYWSHSEYVFPVISYLAMSIWFPPVLINCYGSLSLSSSCWPIPVIPAFGRLNQEDSWVQGQPGLHTIPKYIKYNKTNKINKRERKCPFSYWTLTHDRLSIWIFSSLVLLFALSTQFSSFLYSANDALVPVWA